MKRISLLTCLLLPLCSFAKPQIGVNLDYAAYSSEPENMHGGQIMLSYDPQRFQWRRFNLFFDGGVTRLWTKHDSSARQITIYSIAPVIRYTLKQRGPVKPYIDLSIGLAYLDRTRFDDRNLGMHFSFQDRIGLGVSWGAADQFMAGFHAVHYSNGSLCSHNQGLTIPVMLDVGYRFQ